MRRLVGLWLAWLVLIAGANLASPLYHVYAGRFGFSPLVLTAVFSTYAFVLVPALVLFGRLSDRFGRRPVLASGLGTACVGLILFASAEGEAWLFAARAVQGLAVAMVSGPATAALVELDPDGSRRRAALGAGLAQTLGSAIGPVFAGVLAEFAPYPLRLVYLVAVVLTVMAAVLVLRLPEQRAGAREPWRPQWPRVPVEIRHSFLRVALTGASDGPRSPSTSRSSPRMRRCCCGPMPSRCSRRSRRPRCSPLRRLRLSRREGRGPGAATRRSAASSSPSAWAA